ncbi:PREDICTED: putative nuclease HARBI1 [Atta cephalotes]|uniref:DDE Tnp4 domain-containing protein n=1 Tax=Atta cephalotes TaxID=12957 RepID=A0A158NS74_ATTCE|nr:PREDICTED: putative nuclease HARBI1 [Atta cephalotes]
MTAAPCSFSKKNGPMMPPDQNPPVTEMKMSFVRKDDFSIKILIFNQALFSPLVYSVAQSTIAIKGMLLRKFERVYGFPNVISTIDGIHIKICAPKEDPDLYINRKGFHSMNVQVVCESHELFIYCYAGYVGSVHDTKVFRNSPVTNFLQLSQTYFPNNSHIIGDAAISIHILCVLHNRPHICILQNDILELTDI